MATRKNPKRLQCLKKKSKELSILCDIGVLFICKDIDASSISCSFDSWPEDSKSCLELICKYKKTISFKNGGSSSGSGSVLGKRKESSDTKEDFIDLANKKGKKIDTQMIDFLELAEKVKAGVKNLEYDELIQLLSRVDQTKMGVDQRLQFAKQELDLVCDSDGVDQRLQFVSQEFDLVSDNEGVRSFDGFDLLSSNYGLSFLNGFDLVYRNDGLIFGDGFDLVSGNVVSDGLSFS
ncbi:hypothetical protein Pint_22408 [Pistacia integerrima]|uniref:Uncharacterized protein n=1 Tax=Pistacia integerrima TaxID=434235 RepID=A0ACC0YKE6_9ROSI|nr:hypothetical protein Pint_22408 [Pistacia integerrima]